MLVLSHGYVLADDPVEQGIMRPYPPLGLLSISAWLEQQSIDHQLIDPTFGSRTDLIGELARLRPRMVAFYATLMTRQSLVALIATLRADPRHRDLTVVLGGPDGRHNAADYLRHGVDFVVVGEGEQTMAALATLSPTDLRTPDCLDAIPGLIYAGAGRQPVHTGDRAHLPDLDTLPLPARHRIDLAPYFNAWKTAHGETAINVSTQRGCPYSCTWCSRAVYGTSYRRRAAEQVVAELAALTARYAPDSFWFVDDVFTINHRWLRAFATALEAASLTIGYECITRADRMNDEVVALLASTGCKRVWIGAESGSQRILDAMDRKVTTGQVTAMIRAASAAGIETGTFIMLGYPGETEADILATAHYLRQARPDRFTVTLAYPIKGTRFYDAVSTEVSPPAFGKGSERDSRFPRTYNDTYYRHALTLLTRTHRASKASSMLTVDAWKARLGVVLSRLGMLWHRRFGQSPQAPARRPAPPPSKGAAP